MVIIGHIGETDPTPVVQRDFGPVSVSFDEIDAAIALLPTEHSGRKKEFAYFAVRLLKERARALGGRLAGLADLDVNHEKREIAARAVVTEVADVV